MAEEVGKPVLEFISNFLMEGEKIEGPPILAEKVRIYKDIDRITGVPMRKAEPLAELRNVYVINTNKRILIASRGLARRGSILPTAAYEGYQEGLWKVERTKAVVMEIEDKTGIFPIAKGTVSVSFRMGLAATSTFTTGISKPYIAFLLAMIFGFIMLLAALATALMCYSYTISASLAVIGVILLIVGALINRIRKALVFNPVTSVESTSEIYIFNKLFVPKESTVKKSGNEVMEETTTSILEFLGIHIDLHPAVGPEEVLAFTSQLIKPQ